MNKPADPRHHHEHPCHRHPLDLSDPEVRKAHLDGAKGKVDHPIYQAYLRAHGPMEARMKPVEECPDCVICPNCQHKIHAGNVRYHAEGCPNRSVLG